MKRDEICAMTIEELAALLRRKEVSPVEATRAVLERIEALNPKINAFTTVCRAEAEGWAAEAEKEILAGRYRGPMHGIPIGVKDLYDTAGIRTTYGSAMFHDHVPERDAQIVTRLKQAGAVIVGKTATHELGLGLTTNNAFFGPTRNPWNTEHVPGGSSGGSGAAIAADLCIAATGSDGGGSIRFPCVWCGCVGVKPTVGLVGNRGEFGTPGSSYAVAGPICKTLRDAAIMLSAMAGYDSEDPWSVRSPIERYVDEMEGDVDGVRVGVSPDYFAVPLDPAVRAGYEAALAALQDLGVEIVEIRMPNHERAIAALFLTMGGESAPWYREIERVRRREYGPETEPLVDLGLGFSADDVVRGRIERQLVTRDYVHAFQEVEAIVLPTAPVAAPRIGEEKMTIGGREEMISQMCAAFTAPANMASLPAVPVPSGLTDRGLPVGIQFVTPPLEEALALRLAHAFVEGAPELRRLRSPLAART